MKELLKHLPAIKGFIEERTTAFQEISDNVLKNFLKEAYKLPFLFPVRIIVSEDKFVNFLFDMRKDLFEGKTLETSATEKKEETKEEIATKEVAVEVKEKKPVTKKAVVKNTSTKTVATTKTKSNNTKETKTATTTKKATTVKNTKIPAKKEKLVS
ncbi:MAG: hypothetical protein MUC49_17460 [Raineya sp.]|jgi:hypothetical protein|nr:hypothetical protein [Raineya sp.]